MKAEKFYQKLVEKLTEVGKGDREISLSVGGFSIPIERIVWHEECDEFHIMPAAPSEEEMATFREELENKIKEVQTYIDRANNWMNN